MSRRWFLAGAVATVAACGHRARPRETGTIAVANYPFYIDGATNPGFTATTGIAVEYHEEILDEETWYANVAARLSPGQPFGRDVVVVSDWLAARLERRGWLATPTGAAPWAQGMTGIAYDARATGRDLRQVAELFDAGLHGEVSMPSDPRAALGMTMLANGIDPSTAGHDDIEASAARLADAVRSGQILPIDERRPVERLVAGDAAAAVVRASDTFGLDSTHPDIRFVVADEGGILHTDLPVVPATAANIPGAARYLAYVDDPEHAARRFEAIPAVWNDPQVTQILQETAPDVVADPRRNPPPEVRARLRSFPVLDDAGEHNLGDSFRTVVAAGR